MRERKGWPVSTRTARAETASTLNEEDERSLIGQLEYGGAELGEDLVDAALANKVVWTNA